MCLAVDEGDPDNPDPDNKVSENDKKSAWEEAAGIFGFKGDDLKRMLMYYVAGRIGGGSHAGSFQWAGQQILAETQQRDEENKLALKDFNKHLYENSGRYSPETITKAKELFTAGKHEEAWALLGENKQLTPAEQQAAADAVIASRDDASGEWSGQLGDQFPSRYDQNTGLHTGAGIEGPNGLITPDELSKEYTIFLEDRYPNADANFWKDPAHAGILGDAARDYQAAAEAYRNGTSDTPPGPFANYLERNFIQTKAELGDGFRNLDDQSQASLIDQAGRVADAQGTTDIVILSGLDDKWSSAEYEPIKANFGETGFDLWASSMMSLSDDQALEVERLMMQRIKDGETVDAISFTAIVEDVKANYVPPA